MRKIEENNYAKYTKYETYVSIDEAGLGCMAGPMVFCGLKMKEDGDLSFAKDSKKLTKKKRIELLPLIKENADIKIVSFSSKDVDDYGLTYCIRESLKEIMKYFGNDNYIYDGGNNYGFQELCTLVKGDAKVKSISAASIMAKSYRDYLMEDLHKEYPEYNWIKNSGYITKDHIEKVKQYGFTEYHRLSYRVKALANERKQYILENDLDIEI